MRWLYICRRGVGILIPLRGVSFRGRVMISLALLCTGLLSLVYTAAAGQVVDLGYAKYRGNVTLPNSVAFLGVPYAEPPLGERRWRAPLPLDTARVFRQTKGRVVDASKKPDFCVQGSTGSEYPNYLVSTEQADTGRLRWRRGRCRQ